MTHERGRRSSASIRCLDASRLRLFKIDADAEHFLELQPGCSGFLDTALFFDRRNVTRITVEDDGLKDPPHDLPAPCLGKRTHEVEFANHCDWPEFPANRLNEFALELWRRLVTLLEGDERANHLAP